MTGAAPARQYSLLRAARLTGHPVSELKRLARRGDIAVIRDDDGTVLVDQQQLDALVDLAADV